MQRFKNLLLLISEGVQQDSTIERAASLAQRNDARVTVLAAIEAPPRRMQLEECKGLPSDKLVTCVIEEVRGQAEAAADELRERGLDPAIKTVSGTRFIEVIRQVLHGQHDLVIVTGDGGPHRLLGSTTRHLMRKCPCPVWAIKPTAGVRYPRILAALDPDHADETNWALSHKLLTLASSLARMDQSELHLVHAWELYGEALLRRRERESEVDEMADRMRAVHQQQLDRLLADFALDDLVHQVHLLKGEPGPTIAEATVKLSPDLVVMGTVGRTGLAGYFIGNTAELVLDQVDCSVLAVKPDGFVTPVVAA
jgi:nucleotide-binding universal stress UspA family protein